MEDDIQQMPRQEPQENLKNVTYNYDWKYELVDQGRKFLWKAFKVCLVIGLLVSLMSFAPVWFIYTLLGAFAFAVPSYLMISSLFKVEYIVILVIEGRTLTPYYFPKKLFKTGEWEMSGTKKKYIARIEFAGSSKELDKIIEEIKKVDADIRAKIKVKEELENVIYHFIAMKKAGKKDLKRAYRIATGKQKQNFKKYDNLLKEFNEAKFKKEVLEHEISYLKHLKNDMVESLAFSGHDGGSVFLADSIDWENKRIVFSDVHMYSEIDYLTNRGIFEEMNEKVSNMFEEHSKMKNSFDSRVIEKVGKILNLILIDLKPGVSKYELDKVDKKIRIILMKKCLK